MTLKKINILEYAFGEGGGGHQKAYAVYAFINVDNCERPLNKVTVDSAFLLLSVMFLDVSNDMRCKLHCERLLFVSLLGGAAYAAVSRDFRSVLHLRFNQRVINCFMSIEHAFQIQGFFLLFLTLFIFQVSYPYFRICDNDEPG